MSAPVEEQLIADITKQLSRHMEALWDTVVEFQSRIRNGEVPAERLELGVQHSAASVIAAVGALRALAEVDVEGDDEEDDEPDDED